MTALRRWRWKVFAATWLCYAGYYFCRKPFYIAKSTLGRELDFSASMLGTIGSVYLVAYAVGQFASGALGTRWGPRLTLLLGMAVSIACNVGFGLSNSYSSFLVLMALNGLAQATGWSGTVGTMANWFKRGERGTVMGIWATNYQAGGVLANTLAASALGGLGFRYSFFAGSAVLLAVLAFFAFNQRNKPEDLGLSLGDDAEDQQAGAERGWTKAAAINVLLVGVFYFFVKFIRYSLWSWAPFLLQRNFDLKGGAAGYLSTLFDFSGIAGVVVTGVLSDRVFKSRRAGVSLLMMIAMLASCTLLYFAGGVSVTLFAICLTLIGFTLYGPDALMSGAGAMDIGSKRGAVLAAAVINGMGSIGAVVQELAIGNSYDKSGGSLGPIFLMLFGSAAAAVVAIGIVFARNRAGVSDV